MAEKIVPGTARKVEEIRKIYEIASMKASQKGRLSSQGEEFTGFINEIFGAVTEIEEVPIDTVVEYIREATGNYDNRKKLRTSLIGFLHTKAGKERFFYSDGIVTRREN